MSPQQLMDEKFLRKAESILLRLEKDFPVLNNNLLASELRKIYDEGFHLGVQTGRIIFDAQPIPEDHRLALPELIEENRKELEELFDRCDQCNEFAWDGRICHCCGAKYL